MPYARRVLSVAVALGVRPDAVWELEEGELRYLERVAAAQQAEQSLMSLRVAHSADVKKLAAGLERDAMLDKPAQAVTRDGPDEVRRKLAALGV